MTFDQITAERKVQLGALLSGAWWVYGDMVD